jgi:CRISPR/Cas system endoribonuclease Cas6 (RAMP superfamily)
MSFSNITQITTEHSEWLKGLDFYKEDIHILEHRLAEIVAKNTSFEARQGVEHFQNQFLIQLNNIDELSHKVREHNSFFAKSPLVVEEIVENEKLADHENLKDEYIFFEKIMKELRQEFNIYLSKWM